MRTFNGAWPALVTPLTSDNQIDVSVLAELTEYLIEKGIGGLYLCGSTGQGLFLSVAERKLVLETVMAQANGRLPLIVQIGSLALPDALELTRHAQDTGADGISSVILPQYGDRQSLIDYFATIAAAAPTLPFLPYIFGAAIDGESLMRDLMQIPNVAGTKYTGPNMYQLRHIVDMKTDGWTVFSGMDEQCVFAAMWNSSGNIGSTLNVMPGVYREIHVSCQAGNFERARDLQLQANRVTETLFKYDFMAAMRVALEFLGFSCGDPRLPARPFAEHKKDSLRQDLEAVNFFEVAAM